MSKEEEKYPVDKRFRIKNADMEEKFEDLQEFLENHEDTRKYSDQATMELAINLARKKLEEKEQLDDEIRNAVP